jgi:maltooligosyltrehalose trehalohydrolase
VKNLQRNEGGPVAAGPAAKSRLGATPVPDGRCTFQVWAPQARRVEVRLVDSGRIEPLLASGDGHFAATLSQVEPGAAYLYRLDGDKERPDPASRDQRNGVHGPSRVCDLGSYQWRDHRWRGVPLRDYVIYELHVGTFSRGGTFDAVMPELERLRRLGVTALEIMPVAQFPGARNWGYDGVYPFAVQDSYGGARGLQRLVDACHQADLAVILDVVYNHLGPEGNYLRDFGPYFTDRYYTPWGAALNFDGAENEGVRRFFIENALQWIDDFHIDALRLDAVHAIIDFSARPFLEELADTVRKRGEQLGRRPYLIAESDLNDPRLVRASALGGHGLDAVWSDDFHHAAHSLLTGETSGYYADFGRVEDLARAFQSGMSRPGEYSHYRRRRHGRRGAVLEPEQCVVCIQNHDQIGNRLLGERSATLLNFEQQKLAAAVLCLSPYLPLLFMGEEYGETAPFQYFISHGDEGLLEAVRKGRCQEFASFGWTERPPDPAAKSTFERCILQHELRAEGTHQLLHRWYGALLQLRASLPRELPDECVAFEGRRVLFVRRPEHAWMVYSFSAEPCELVMPVPPGTWQVLLSSTDAAWGGHGPRGSSLLESGGEVHLQLPPHSFLCCGRPAPG